MSQPNPDSAHQEATDSEALALLKRPDLLTHFQEIIEQCGCVGEVHNKTLLYLIYTSRKLEKPISTIVKGGSASGKSSLVLSVGEFFPPDEVIGLSNMTAKSLYHWKEPLAHKVLLVMEHAGAEAVEYAIRTLLSEGQLEHFVTIGDPATGFSTQRIRVEGPICFIVTTTLPQLDEQNESRCFTIYADDSEEQTKRIHTSQRDRYREARIAASRVEVWRRAQQLLQSRPVRIPYAHLIEFPTKPLRVRRDHPRFLALIEASAFLHQYQREGGAECIVANLDDYRVAYELSAHMLPGLLETLSPGAEQVIETAQENWKDKQFTLKELREKLGWDRKTLTKRINEVIAAGYVGVVSSGIGQKTHYQLDKDRPIQNNRSLLLTPEALQARIQASGNLGNLSIPEETPHGQVNP